MMPQLRWHQSVRMDRSLTFSCYRSVPPGWPDCDDGRFPGLRVMAAWSCLPACHLASSDSPDSHQMTGSSYIPPTVAGAATDWLPDHHRPRQSIRRSLLIRLRGTIDLIVRWTMRQVTGLMQYRFLNDPKGMVAITLAGSCRLALQSAIRQTTLTAKAPCKRVNRERRAFRQG